MSVVRTVDKGIRRDHGRDQFPHAAAAGGVNELAGFAQCILGHDRADETQLDRINVFGLGNGPPRR